MCVKWPSYIILFTSHKDILQWNLPVSLKLIVAHECKVEQMYRCIGFWTLSMYNRDNSHNRDNSYNMNYNKKYLFIWITCKVTNISTGLVFSSLLLFNELTSAAKSGCLIRCFFFTHTYFLLSDEKCWNQV